MKLRLLLVLSIFLMGFQLSADSPLTSTYFAKNYKDLEIVAYAIEKGVMDQKIADYLLKKKNPIDIKAAVINGLSWDISGKTNSQLFKEFIAKKFGKEKFDDVSERKIKDHMWFSLGYLTALDDYFNPSPSLVYFEKVKKKKLLNSFTYQAIKALVNAQIAMNTDWCKVWRVYEEVINNSALKKDMREEAQQSILSYISLYKSSCE